MVKNPQDSLGKASPGLHTDDGRDARIDGTVTEAKDRLIEELREAISSRDDFLAIAAHELRNPLTPILLSVQIMRLAQESGNQDTAAAEVNRLERLINHFASRTQMLLEVAQLASKKFRIELEELNLSELVTGVVSDYGPLIDRSGSPMTTSIQEGIIGFVDRMAVAEIVENLISNAIKYGQRMPIEIILEAADGQAQITVRDYGIGIAAADRERIFNRFERAVGREVHSGFGIGLWLVRNLAESMGGSITVVGESGVGSVFTVSLPLRPPLRPEGDP